MNGPNLFFQSLAPQQTKFFTGNTAVDAGAAGAALGLGAHYFANQLFNPCRSNGGVRNRNTNKKNTSNRIFGGQFGNAAVNGLLGFGAAFAAASVANNALGNPCGR